MIIILLRIYIFLFNYIYTDFFINSMKYILNPGQFNLNLVRILMTHLINYIYIYIYIYIYTYIFC